MIANPLHANVSAVDPPFDGLTERSGLTGRAPGGTVKRLRPSEDSDAAFELLAGLTARLASTANLEEITRLVSDEIAALGFGAVWIAVVQEATNDLLTIRELIDGRDTTHEMPLISLLDMRQPIGHGFRQGRMINIQDPDSLLIIEHPDDAVPMDRMALPRVIFEHLRGHPFACGPLLGSRGQPVGALGLSSYRGRQPIPKELFDQGLLRAFMNHLGIAMERALHLKRLERINSELVHAQQVLVRESRVRAVGELTTAVAHDLNNLAHIILMSAGLGKRSQADAIEAMTRIEAAARATGELVSRLQRVARTGTDTNITVIDLDQIIEDIVAMLTPVCREESIALVLRLERRSFVVADESMARQAIINLMRNAREALLTVAPAGRRIELSTTLDGDCVLLVVRDTGPGLPEPIDQCFEPFMTTKGPQHAGIGLASVHGAMKHFGGGVSACNEETGGARFTLRFSRAAERPTAAPLPVPMQTTPTDHLHVLVIDDEPDVLDVLLTFTRLLGHEGVSALTPAAALTHARARRFDVVLCDFGLPSTNGLELCRQLAVIQPNARLVLMTGWDGAAVKSDPRSAICATILQKPIEQADLAHVFLGIAAQ